VTLRARWVALRARWVALRARWVALRARWVMLGDVQVATLVEHTDAVTALVLSSRNLSSAILFSASLDGSVRVWNLMGGCALCTLKGHMGGVNALVLSTVETTLFSASEDGSVRMWEASKGFTPLEWWATNPRAHPGQTASVSAAPLRCFLILQPSSSFGVVADRTLALPLGRALCCPPKPLQPSPNP
jgi:WD40 repeat protein